MSFLPEDDVEYLQQKGWKYEEKSEQAPDGTVRNAVLFPEFRFEGNLFESRESGLVQVSTCALLVLIPSGYATTKLDSFYTIPRLKLANGTDPIQTSHTESLFQQAWQFWSRHLDASDWRAGIDGIDTFIQFILLELSKG